MTPLRVGVMCESSGRVREAFRRRGHDAWSCDLDPAEDGSPFHLQGDARWYIATRSWDIVIAHPPCTRLTLAGVRWLHERDLWADLERDAAFFRNFIGCAPKVCIENPIPHGHAARLIGRKYTQIIEPWQFWHLDAPGAGEKKSTCLWLENLPPLVPTTPHETGRHQACWRMAPTKDKRQRAIARSRTYFGIADAMAAQWSPDLSDKPWL